MNSEQFLTDLSNRFPQVYFLEVGAMDGQSFDLLHPFIHEYNWKGILVEPLPDLFAELKSNYLGCEGLVFENVAIAEIAETRTMYRIPTEAIRAARLPAWAKGISSLYPDRNAIGGKNGLLSGAELPKEFYAKLEKHIVEQLVSCVPLPYLLNKHDLERIDVLQIDTEGYDYQVFRQFDFGKYSPWFIKVEVGNLIPEEYEKVLDILEMHSYQYTKEGLDVLAWKKLPVVSD